MTTETLADGLRELANFLDLHPELAEALGPPTLYLWASDEAKFKANNALLGTFTKSSTGSYLNATKAFGPVTVESTIQQSNICEKKVVGTRKVMQYVPVDPDYIPPLVEYHNVEVEEEVTEWLCPPAWR